MLSQNPYPLPPPPVAHKVWILDCKSCGLFLTNRAMKAVLLLRPNVSLYSSDASPVNCSAYAPEADEQGLSPACRPAPSRTCDCLTQTLCCHGCGNPVGYMIVIPCTRCTSSISSSNRATNGHRFVFHSSEIVGTERHYVPNEPGVTPFEPVAFIPPTLVVPSQHPNPYPSPRESPTSPFPPPHVHPFAQRPTSPSDYPPTPSLEYATHYSPRAADPYHATMSQSTMYHIPPQTYAYASPSGGYHRSYSPAPPHISPYRPHYSIPPPPGASTMESQVSPPPALADTAVPYDHKELPFTPRKLKAGNLLFWHHLTRSGEIPGAQNDERARHGASPLSDNALGIVFNR
ncbi:hypothetical protein D9611_003987 [Ephemerocybe angulata]|uniref:Protein FAM72A n=1 Tax=Ephemerocybe angulata TaxID=980116 RepID=A0A8H5EYE6_9AGAR|nr:hypothetical protein D9611_003987 [Tulosesus angulatus]